MYILAILTLVAILPTHSGQDCETEGGGCGDVSASITLNVTSKLFLSIILFLSIQLYCVLI